jgi:Tfp pilus assembly protein PilF
LGNHLKALGLLYVRPFKAVSLILDRGRLSIALVLAAFTGAVPGYLLYSAAMLGGADFPLSTIYGPVFYALILLAAVFVPAAVIVVNLLEGTGSAGVVLPRDYMPMLVCHLMVYAAVMIPVSLIERIPFDFPQYALSSAAVGYFAFLSVCVVRTLAGTGFGRAVATVVSAAAVSVGGLYVFTLVSGALYFLASPFALYFLYIMFGQGIGSELRGIGGGLSSRQRMRQLLETSTVNPRDADARYQLGLIYQQRRDYEQAKKCFEEAIAIDKQEAEPHYQLGRVLRAQGHFAEALEHLKTAAAIDNKLSQSEVLRETGATLLDLGRDAEARDILREYTNRRSFDAEGCYWYGVALSRLGENQAAKEALQQSIESVRTAPSHLRRQASKWESAARKQLRQL